MNIAELRFLAETSCDPVILEAFGIESVNEFNLSEDVHTGAIESIQHAFSLEVKTAKNEISETERSIMNNNKAEAKKHLNAAISAIESGREKAEQIDDDGILESFIISSILSLLPGVGSIAYRIGFYYEWYCLRRQSSKGEVYSKIKPERRKDLILEAIFGKYRRAGYSRAAVLQGYDRMLDQVKMLNSRIDSMPNK